MTEKYLYLIIGSVLSCISAVVFILSRDRFSDIEKAADKTIYPFSFCMRAGFYVSHIIGLSSGIPVEKLPELFRRGCDGSDFTGFCLTSHAISVFLLSLPAGTLVSAITGEPLCILLFTVISALLSMYPVFEMRKRSCEKSAAVVSGLPDVLSRLSLLVCAGMTLYDAWTTISDSGTGPVFSEMKKVTDDIDNGLSMREALNGMAERCQVKQVSRFASAIARNTDSGGSTLSQTLRSMAKDMWEEKAAVAITKGKAAEQKLMLPLLVMFVGIIIMIIVPLFAGF